MSSRRSVVVVLVAGVIATAEATAPCFEVCHLAQSQPLLVDNDIWVRPCATVKGKETCVLQRLDVDGRVLATLPGATMTLRLDKTTLICERTSGVIKRSLGCRPSALSVRAATAMSTKQPTRTHWRRPCVPLA